MENRLVLGCKDYSHMSHSLLPVLLEELRLLTSPHLNQLEKKVPAIYCTFQS